MEVVFDVEQIKFEECSLKEILTITAYLILYSDLDETVTIDKCVSLCAQKLESSLIAKEPLTSEYFYLLDILKKKKRSLDKKDSKRKYLKSIENIFQEKKMYLVEEKKEEPFSEILIKWINDESCYQYIRMLLERDRNICNYKINGKHIVFYILEKYINNFKIMIKNKNGNYINKDYLREIYYLFTKSYYLHMSPEEKTELDSIINEFMEYIKTNLVKEYRINAALKELKTMKSKNFYKFVPEYSFPSYSDDALNYETTRITSSAKTTEPADEAFLFRDRAYRIEENKVNIYVMDVSPYIAENSIMNNYLEYLEYEKVKMDSFIEENFSYKVGNSYNALCYTIEFFPSGIVKCFDVSKRKVHIKSSHKSLADFDGLATELNSLYKKASLKKNGSYASYDLSRINEFFDTLVTEQFIDFIRKNNLPFLYYGYRLKSEAEATNDLNEYVSLLSGLSKQDACLITKIICSNTDKTHYSVMPFRDGVYKMVLTDHKNYISLLNERILHDLYFNDRLLDKTRIQKLKKSYARKFQETSEELNEINDYMDDESLKASKGRIRKKICLPSLTE